MAQIITKLQEKIKHLRERSIDGRYFIDPNNVRHLFSTSTIAEALAECGIPDYQLQDIASKIRGDGIILFSILIWRGWHGRLVDFVEHDIWDTQLPLELSKVETIVESIAIDFATEAQWEFLPRKLTREMHTYHCNIRDEEILPFVKENFIGEGSLADVSAISIPASMQNLLAPTAPETTLVLKRLRVPVGSSKIHQQFQEREKECLRILDHMRHPNVVPLLASFTYLRRQHLLFPVFKMDLEAFMGRGDRYGHFENDFVIYDALQGLLSAIKMVHSLEIKIRGNNQDIRRNGYHHDIRPANILVDDKTFYLADFGLARMKLVDEKSQTRWKAGLGDFLGPECLNPKDLSENEVGRALDIWSFGCTIFEIVAYIHGGPSEVKRFQELRRGHALRPNMADKYFFTSTTVRPSITSWADEIKTKSGDHSLRDLVALGCSMLQINPADRPSAIIVHQQMRRVSLRALFHATISTLANIFPIRNRSLIIVSSKEAHFQRHRFAAWARVIGLEDEKLRSDITEYYDAIWPALFSIFELGEAIANVQKDPSLELIDHGSFVEQFSQQVEILYNVVGEHSQDRMKQAWLRSLLAAKELSPSPQGQGTSDQERDWLAELGKFGAARTRKQYLTEEDISEIESNKREPDRYEISLNKLSILDELSDNVVNAIYQRAPVLVELIPKTHKWLEMTRGEQQQRLSKKVEALRRGSSIPGFAILECVGFFMATCESYTVKSCGLVYALPTRDTETSRATAPISLARIIKTKALVGFPLEERFQVAHKLALCIRELHIAGWLHKNITSENIILFESSCQEGNVIGTATSVGLLQAPYLINFRHARPTISTYQTEHSDNQASSMAIKYARQPEYVAGKRNFEMADDYYGLGVVLLELGSWATLDVYLENCGVVSPEPETFRQLLIEKYAPRLKHLMGTNYANTVLKCLTCEFGTNLKVRDPERRSTMILERFYDEVVNPLGQLSKSPL